MSRRRRSRATPEPSDDQLRLIKRQGWTLSLASYVRALYWPALPKFPLDDDILAELPDDLPDNNEPFDLEELLAISNGEPDLLAPNPEEDDLDLPEGPDIQDEHDWAVREHIRKHGWGHLPDSLPPSPAPPRVPPAIVISGLRCPVCRHVLAHLEPRARRRSMRMARCPSCGTRWSSEGAH